MKPAGPLRGIRRAVDHAMWFVVSFGLAGFIAIPLLLAIGGKSEVTAALLVAHVAMTLVQWPSAVVMTWLCLRACRPRSWRHQLWRAWVAGLLGAPFAWGGSMLGDAFGISGGPDVLVSLFGRLLGRIALLYGLIVIFSNLAILVAWMLPARAGRPLRFSRGGK
jgi:hypothetical protein